MAELKLPGTIKMVITDFDGVVTDNCVYISDNGDMSRRLNFMDVMGFSILKKSGYEIGIIFHSIINRLHMFGEFFTITFSFKKIETQTQSSAPETSPGDYRAACVGWCHRRSPHRWLAYRARRSAAAACSCRSRSGRQSPPAHPGEYRASRRAAPRHCADPACTSW